MSKFSKGNKWASKLSNEDVLVIRQRYVEGGVTQMDLAIEYHVSLNTIRYAIKGVTHQNVPMVESADQVFTQAQDSQRKLLMRLETEDLTPVERTEPAEDPVPVIVARGEPLSVSMARIREAEEAEHAQRMQGLKAFGAGSPMDTAEHTHSEENPHASDV